MSINIEPKRKQERKASPDLGLFIAKIEKNEEPKASYSTCRLCGVKIGGSYCQRIGLCAFCAGG